MTRAEQVALEYYKKEPCNEETQSKVTSFIEGFRKAEADLIPLIHKLAESILFDYDNRTNVAKEVLSKLYELKGNYAKKEES